MAAMCRDRRLATTAPLRAAAVHELTAPESAPARPGSGDSRGSDLVERASAKLCTIASTWLMVAISAMVSRALSWRARVAVEHASAATTTS